LKDYIIAFLTFEPLHIHQMTLLTSFGVFLRLYVLQYQRYRRTVQTVKLTLHHRTTASLLECRIIDPNPKQRATLRA
jgi:hypothetical protein